MLTFDFTILDSAKSVADVRILESLSIYILKPITVIPTVHTQFLYGKG